MQQPYYTPPAQKPYGNQGKQSFQKGKKGKQSRKGYSYPVPNAKPNAVSPDTQDLTLSFALDVAKKDT